MTTKPLGKKIFRIQILFYTPNFYSILIIVKYKIYQILNNLYSNYMIILIIKWSKNLGVNKKTGYY